MSSLLSQPVHPRHSSEARRRSLYELLWVDECRSRRRLSEVLAGAFSGTSLANLVIPETVLKLGEGSFRGCTKLTHVVVGSGVREIPSSAFYGCYELSALKIGPKSTWVRSLSG